MLTIRIPRFGLCMLLSSLVVVILTTDVPSARRASAQDLFELAPIEYETAATNDPIAQLQHQMESGAVTLPYDEKHGYLPAVLEKLGIPIASQGLVFSQTSFQLRKISPSRPRAIYFNDSTYVGWVQSSDVLELAAIDAQQGPIFYTLKQSADSKPRFERDRGQCIACHATNRTQRVPGLLVRSVFVDQRGIPQQGTRNFLTDHTSPFAERWGGWYVTGLHGQQRHMGNVYAADRSQPEHLDREAGANVTDLARFCNTSAYLSPHSDIVALLVLEHQTQMQNAITRANYEARMAEHHDQVMNRALDRAEGYRSESTQRRIAAASDNLLKYLLLADELRLTAPVQGTSSFAAEFAATSVRDPHGRSLRDLDLQSRLFKYPCSFLIYSASFDALPELVKQHVYEGLGRILRSETTANEFAHLSRADRQAILEILAATKPDFAEFIQQN